MFERLGLYYVFCRVTVKVATLALKINITLALQRWYCCVIFLFIRVACCGIANITFTFYFETLKVIFTGGYFLLLLKYNFSTLLLLLLK